MNNACSDIEHFPEFSWNIYIYAITIYCKYFMWIILLYKIKIKYTWKWYVKDKDNICDKIIYM